MAAGKEAQGTQAGVQALSAQSANSSLPYPERFHAANKFIQLGLPGSKQLSQETQLLLYALSQQATQGPCNVSKPWGWNMVESTKHDAWKELGQMSKVEAMRLYVRTVEEEQPDWYGLLLQEEAGSTKAVSNGKGPGPATLPAAAYAMELTWTQLPVSAPAAAETNGGGEGEKGSTGGADSSRRPCPRYEHGAALVGNNLYVIAGNYAGRYLSDMWRMDTTTLQWSLITPIPATAHAPASASLPTSPRTATTPAAAAAGPTPFAQSAGGAAAPADTAAAAAKGNGPAAGAAAPGKEGEAKDASKEKDQAPAAPQGLPPIAGHSVTVWGNKLLVLGGHVKAKTPGAAAGMPVRVYDTSSNTLATLNPSGTPPIARGGHSATLIGSKLWIFGGEDASRRPLGDLHYLDLSTLAWSGPLTLSDMVTPETAAAVKKSKAGELAVAPPAPRSAHAAASYLDRYLLIFGGGSLSSCFSDVAVLDTEAKQWLAPRIVGAKGVSPRAGHSGAIVGNAWYIVGGGNNVKGCTDLLALDLSALPSGGPLTWHILASTPARDPLSSEGVSLLLLTPPVPAFPPSLAGDPSKSRDAKADAGKRATNGGAAAPQEPASQQQQSNEEVEMVGGVLLAFGGYNGKYQNAVSVLRALPKLPPPGSPPVQTTAAAAPGKAAPAAATPSGAAAAGKGQSAAGAAEAQGKSQGGAASAQGGAAPAPGATPTAGATAAKAGQAPAAASAPASARGTSAGGSPEALIAELQAALAAARKQAEAAVAEAAAAKEGAAHELALLRKQLATTQAALETATKGLEEARAALSREAAKVMRLEGEAAEAAKRLAGAAEDRKELEALRRQVKEVEEKSKKGGGGIWGYIAGSSS